MKTSLERDLQRLSALAYRRLEESGEAVKAFHRLRDTQSQHPDTALLERVYGWLLVPFTLWAIDFQGLFKIIQQCIEDDCSLDSEIRFLIQSLPPLPGEKAQNVASAHELAVQHGDYEAQVKAGEKYRLQEQMLLQNQRFHEGWTAIKANFEVEQYRDRKGVIRRRMVSERGFRPDWELRWQEPADRFQAVFDVFCQRWNLYGMKDDHPLLQKVTVNLTPNGTMVFILSWWSLDSRRDLNWSEIKRLHKVRAPSKQGAKLTKNQIDQAAEAERAATFDVEARLRGLKGEKGTNWVMAKMKWPVQDVRKLRLVLSRAKRVGSQNAG
jgi:hypothetical protein